LGVANGRMTVAVGEKLRMVAEWQGPAPAGEVTLMLRPERIRIDWPGSEAAENRFTATLSDIVYLGEDVSLTMRLDGGLELTVTAKSDARSRALVPGARVELSAEPADLHVLAS